MNHRILTVLAATAAVMALCTTSAHAGDVEGCPVPVHPCLQAPCPPAVPPTTDCIDDYVGPAQPTAANPARKAVKRHGFKQHRLHR